MTVIEKIQDHVWGSGGDDDNVGLQIFVNIQFASQETKAIQVESFTLCILSVCPLCYIAYIYTIVSLSRHWLLLIPNYFILIPWVHIPCVMSSHSLSYAFTFLMLCCHIPYAVLSHSLCHGFLMLWVHIPYAVLSHSLCCAFTFIMLCFHIPYAVGSHSLCCGSRVT